MWGMGEWLSNKNYGMELFIWENEFIDLIMITIYVLYIYWLYKSEKNHITKWWGVGVGGGGGGGVWGLYLKNRNNCI